MVSRPHFFRLLLVSCRRGHDRVVEEVEIFLCVGRVSIQLQQQKASGLGTAQLSRSDFDADASTEFTYESLNFRLDLD